MRPEAVRMAVVAQASISRSQNKCISTLKTLKSQLGLHPGNFQKPCP
jgi:hypothetical protein